MTGFRADRHSEIPGYRILWCAMGVDSQFRDQLSGGGERLQLVNPLRGEGGFGFTIRDAVSGPQSVEWSTNLNHWEVLIPFPLESAKGPFGLGYDAGVKQRSSATIGS